MENLTDPLGTDLYAADDICDALRISKSTFNRLTRDASASPVSVLADLMADAQDAAIGLTPFPKPIIYVMGYPRWSRDSINKWVLDNAAYRSARGAHLQGTASAISAKIAPQK